MKNDSEALLRDSEHYIDAIFGPGSGTKHSRFLARIEDDGLRATIHRYHLMEGDTTHLSLQENYLLGLVVLLTQRSFGTAAMFAKTLAHLGTPKEKILTAVARLSMYVGGLHTAEASACVQRALSEYESRGAQSLEAWFPES